VPHIRARGIDVSALTSVADDIVESIAEVTNTPADHFTVEHIPSEFIVKGGASPAYPFIEILWFDRGQEVKTSVAIIVDDILRPIVGTDKDITVVFSDLRGQDYYENKTHF
jgi:hypothetical protein